MSVCINPGVNLRVQVHNLRTVGPLHVTLCMACIPSAEYYLMTLTSISWSTDFVKLHHLNLISGQGLAGATLPSDRFVVFFLNRSCPLKWTVTLAFLLSVLVALENFTFRPCSNTINIFFVQFVTLAQFFPSL